MDIYEKYESPFSTRYTSKDMQYLFSAKKKFSTWRALWIALAKAQKREGLAITDEQIAELEEYKDTLNLERASELEREFRHDVMAHIHAYGEQCPRAKGIIHLGATSCFVGDNTDVVIMKEALILIEKKLCTVIKQLSDFATEYRHLPALGYTHLQPAQPTTVGKRATLWTNELLLDLEEVRYRIQNLQMLGSKGTTGSQASFLELFGGDTEKIANVDKFLCAEMGFTSVVPVSGQTYSRKVDANILATLSGIAQSASKFSHDMRLLQSFKEMEEPFEKHQVGSSAMPYKRNPMRCERISAIARHVIINSLNPAMTSATQWFERTLDDSANKRLAVSEAFLGVDAILEIMLNVTKGLVVYPKVVEQRLMKELPFMASENIMMSAVSKGGDRQELHELIRVHSLKAAAVVKEEGGENDLIARLVADPAFMLTEEEITEILNPHLYTGLCAQQVERFVKECVLPAIEGAEQIEGADLKV